MNDLGHWVSLVGDFDPIDHHGFIYKIVNTNDNTYYFGKKVFWNSIKRKPLKGTKRVRKDTRESKWKTYTSSGSFKELIEENGMDDYTFEIVALCDSKNDLNVCEIEHIVKHGRDILNINYSITRGASYKNLKE